MLGNWWPKSTIIDMLLFVADGTAWFPEQTNRSRLGSESAGDDHRHGIRRHQSVSFCFSCSSPSCLPSLFFSFRIYNLIWKEGGNHAKTRMMSVLKFINPLFLKKKKEIREVSIIKWHVHIYPIDIKNYCDVIKISFWYFFMTFLLPE